MEISKTTGGAVLLKFGAEPIYLTGSAKAIVKKRQRVVGNNPTVKADFIVITFGDEIYELRYSDITLVDGVAPVSIDAAMEGVAGFFIDDSSSSGNNAPTTSVKSNQSVNNMKVLEALYKTEFELFSGLSANINGFNGSYLPDGTPAIAVNALVKTLYQIVPTGYRAKVYSVTFSAVSACRFDGYYSINYLTPTNETLKEGIYALEPVLFGDNGGNATLNFGDGIELFELGRLNFDVYSRSTKYPQPTMSVIGRLIPQDSNVNAKNVIATIGLSNSTPKTINITTPPAFYGISHYLGRIQTMLTPLGFDTRKRYMGFNAARIQDNVSDIMSGRLDYGIFPDLLFIDAMVNDAISVGTVAQNPNYQPNFEKILDWAFEKNPDISIIAMGAATTDRAGSANLPAYKALVQTIIALPKYAAKVANNQLKYYDAATNLVANNTNFVEQSATQYLHPNGVGHGIIAAGLWPVVQTMKFYLDNI